MGQASRDRKYDKTSPGITGLLAISLAAGWVWLVASTHLHEMIVGAVVVVLSTLFMVLVSNSKRERLEFHWKDLVQCWQIPWSIASRLWEISVLLFKDLFLRQRAGSYYRVCEFKSSQHDPKIVAREVLATIYTSVAPNFLIIGIDPQSSRMLFHQIERTSVPKMLQVFGAQP